MHPDHIGLAHWLTERWAVRLWVSATDYNTARLSSSSITGFGGEATARFMASHGLTDPDSQAQIKARTNYYANMVPKVPVSYRRLMDGDRVRIGGHTWVCHAGYGHAPEHMSLHCEALSTLISGDMVLPRISTNVSVHEIEPESNPLRLYLDSIARMKALPEDTLVFPAHDYKGDTVSTIGEEKRYNPRLQVRSVDEYIDLMGKLNLPNPKMMDVAVPANLRQGLAQDEIARRGWAVTVQQALALAGQADVALVDLRERSERDKHGIIPGSLHAPYPDLQENIRAGGMLHELASATAKRIVFYCAFGERSAMAVQAAQDAGIASACHIHGGIDAWRKANGVLAR